MNRDAGVAREKMRRVFVAMRISINRMNSSIGNFICL